MSRPEEKALRITLLAAFVLVAIFAFTLYQRRPVDETAVQQAQRDQTLLETVQNSAPTIGPANAPVTIAEFSDFQCPYCKNVSPLMDRAMQEYPDKVRRVWIYVTNPSHAQSESAAVAASCAAKQGYFWQYHDRLFELQDNLGPATYNQIAQSLDLDTKAFQACIADRATVETVRSHTQFAQRAGVTATPYVTVNSTAFTSEFTWEDLKTAIEAALP